MKFVSIDARKNPAVRWLRSTMSNGFDPSGSKSAELFLESLRI